MNKTMRKIIGKTMSTVVQTQVAVMDKVIKHVDSAYLKASVDAAKTIESPVMKFWETYSQGEKSFYQLNKEMSVKEGELTKAGVEIIRGAAKDMIVVLDKTIDLAEFVLDKANKGKANVQKDILGMQEQEVEDDQILHCQVVIELYLCERKNLVPQEDVCYKFVPHEGCSACESALLVRELFDLYGLTKDDMI